MMAIVRVRRRGGTRVRRIERPIAVSLELVATADGRHTAVWRIQKDCRVVGYKRHWSVGYGARNAWKRLMGLAYWEACGVTSAEAFHLACNDLEAHRRRAPQVLYDLEVIRETPTRRNFALDTDNRVYMVKPICDALKGLGFIFEDRERYLRHHFPPPQRVSSDGQYWTEIRLTPWWLPVPLGPHHFPTEY